MAAAGTQVFTWRRAGIVIAIAPVITWWLERLIAAPLSGWFYPDGSFALGGDFRTLYTAAYLAVHGGGDTVYDVAEFQSVVVTGGGYFGPFANPPPFLIPLAPFGWLSFEVAWVVSALLSIIGLAVGFHLLGVRRVALATVVALLFPPVYYTITFGQASVLWLVILAGLYRLIRNDRMVAAGAVAGLLIMKPPLALGLAVWWLFDWKRYAKAAVAAVAASFAYLAASFVVFPDVWPRYGDSVAALVSEPGHAFGQWAQFSLWSSWRLLFPNNDSLAQIAGVVAVIVVAILILPRLRRITDETVGFATAMVLTVLAAPYLIAYDWTLLIIPAVLLWRIAPGSRDQIVTSATIIAIASAWSTIIVTSMLDRWGYAVQAAPLVLLTVVWTHRDLLSDRASRSDLEPVSPSLESGP